MDLLQRDRVRGDMGSGTGKGEGPGRIYVVEPTGPFMDDPNVTDKKFPGNPTKSYRSKDPLRVVIDAVTPLNNAQHVTRRFMTTAQAFASLNYGSLLTDSKGSH